MTKDIPEFFQRTYFYWVQVTIWFARHVPNQSEYLKLSFVIMIYHCSYFQNNPKTQYFSDDKIKPHRQWMIFSSEHVCLLWSYVLTKVENMQKCEDGRQATFHQGSRCELLAHMGHNFEEKINSFQITSYFSWCSIFSSHWHSF